MMKNIKTHIALAIIAAIMAMVSCSYPFEIDVEGEGGAMVIQGDILIGEYTTVRVSHSSPISDSFPEESTITADVSVVDDEGTVYPAVNHTDDGYIIDTRTADPNRLYKLRVKKDRTYESPLQPVNRPAAIDNLSYILDKERNEMNIAISIHSESGSYFKWSYVEDWEYHALKEATCIYIPPKVLRYDLVGLKDVTDGPGEIVLVTEDNQAYRCWSHNESKNILVFSTENQKEDRFVDLEFYTIDRSDRRISYIYHIDVKLESLTRDAYKYWETVRNNSDYTGSLFSPNPSELRGNITCQEDPSEFVYGYISVAQRSSKAIYILDSETGFFIDKYIYDTELHKVSNWYEAYREKGLLPYQGPDPKSTLNLDWIDKRCVDCSLFGGSPKGRPDFWAY